MPEQQGWTPIEEPSGWTPVAQHPKHPEGRTTNADLLRMRSGVRPEMTEGELTSPSFIDRLSEQMRGPAHPGSASELLPTLLPEMPVAVANGVRTVAANLKGTLAGGRLLSAPGRIIGRVVDRFNDPLTIGERTFRDAPLYQQMESLPTEAVPSARQTVVTRPAAGKMLAQTAQGPAEVPGPIRSAAPPYTPSAPATPPLPKTTGRLRLRSTVPNESAPVQPATPAPVTIEQAQAAALPDVQPMTAPRSIAPAVDPMQAAIDAKRYEVGSRAMGREFQTGPGKTGVQAGQDVRDLSTAKSVVGAGEASPVLPTKPFNAIFDKMRAMAPDARPAYVEAARDPKAYAQIETIRRTLERLGLSASATAILRDALLRSMTGPDATPTGQQ